jgi:hypothetical protein
VPAEPPFDTLVPLPPVALLELPPVDELVVFPVPLLPSCAPVSGCGLRKHATGNSASEAIQSGRRARIFSRGVA